MKTITRILILTFTLSFSQCGAAYARDCSRAEMLSDTFSDRIENARENADYTPAVRPEASREVMIFADRNARNRSYRPADTRFTTGKMAEIITAKSDKPELSITEVRSKMWEEAYKKSPALFEIKQNVFPNTFLWYQLKDIETQDNIDAQITIKDIIQLTK